MSKKKDIVIVGLLSTTLFAGFTAYSQAIGKEKALAAAAAPPVAITAAATVYPAKVATPTAIPEPLPGNNLSQKKTAVQTIADPAPTDPAPPATAPLKKNTKTKAS